MKYKDLLKLEEFEWYNFTSTFKGVECTGVIRKVDTMYGFYFILFSNCEKFNLTENTTTINPYSFGVDTDAKMANVYKRSWKVAKHNFTEFIDFKIIE